MVRIINISIKKLLICLSLSIASCNNNKPEIVKYTKDGNIEFRVQTKNGKWDGSYTEFYKNGTKKIVAIYNNGLLSGKFTFYDSKGNLVSVNNYTKGILNGKQMNYYKNGKIKTNYNCVNNRKDGESRFYNNKGNLYYINYYDKGKFLGYKKFESGKLIGQSPDIVFTVYNDKGIFDTIVYYRKTYILHIEVKNHLNDGLVLIVGNKNKDDGIIDTLYKSEFSKGYNVKYKFTPEKHGYTILKGNLYDIKLIGDKKRVVDVFPFSYDFKVR